SSATPPRGHQQLRNRANATATLPRYGNRSRVVSVQLAPRTHSLATRVFIFASATLSYALRYATETPSAVAPKSGCDWLVSRPSALVSEGESVRRSAAASLCGSRVDPGLLPA